MSVWSGTIPTQQRSRWLLLLLAVVAYLCGDPDDAPAPQIDDGPEDNWGGW